MKFRLDIFKREIKDYDDLIRRVKIRQQIELDELHYKHTLQINELKFKHGIVLKKLKDLHETELLIKKRLGINESE